MRDKIKTVKLEGVLIGKTSDYMYAEAGNI